LDDSLPIIAGQKEETMFAFLEKRHVDRDLVVAQRFKEDNAIVDVDQIVIGGLKDQCGRGLFCNLKLV
jgi:hypothetical protein